MTRVLVLAGGASDEREVSLRSGAAVVEALISAGHSATQAEPNDLASLSAADFDVVFPALHGVGGEDGTIQANIEEFSLPYVGSGVASSQLCFDKWQWRVKVGDAGLPVADGALVSEQELADHHLARNAFVLKPFDGGSSIDTFIVRDVTKIPWADIQKAFTHHPKMLIEQLVEGIEITVAVLGDQALPVIEIIPPESGEFDYENKYNGASQELCPPQNVSPEIQTKAQQLAARIHKLCGCQDLSRTDMIVSTDGALTVLETNTIPGLTAQSLFPKAAAEAGLSMPELCDKLITMALSRGTASA